MFMSLIIGMLYQCLLVLASAFTRGWLSGHHQFRGWDGDVRDRSLIDGGVLTKPSFGPVGAQSTTQHCTCIDIHSWRVEPASQIELTM